MMWQAAADDDDDDNDSVTPLLLCPHLLDQLQLNDANRQLCTKVCNTFLQQAFAHHNMLPRRPSSHPLAFLLSLGKSQLKQCWRWLGEGPVGVAGS